MKKIVILIVALTFANFVTPAAAEDWHLVHVNDETWHFIDVDSKTPTTFWSGFLSPESPTVSLTKARFGYRCDSREYRLIFEATYDLKGRLIATENGPEPWEPAIPGTHADSALQFVCDGIAASEKRVGDLQGFAIWLRQKDK